MKEKIYTIPLNEAFETSCECPLCKLEQQLEQEAVDYTLGAAMMEPDFRIESNEKGFCNHHYSLLFSQKNKLSLALILETHLQEIIEKLDSLKTNPEKSAFLKKPTNNKLFNSCSSCIVCDKINNTMERYIDVFFYMWSKDENFKNKVLKSKGFCLKHFETLFKNAYKYLNKNEAQNFLNILKDKEKDELMRIHEDIHKFTLKFDYRNKDMDWGTAIDAPIRTVEKLSGYINQENNPEK